VLNAITDVHAAVDAPLWVLAGPSGTCLLGVAPTPASESGAFAAALRVAPERVLPTRHQPTTSHKYQNMTRIAATGGNVSGSHPAWDPV
jgi:hypothetical protein